MMITAIDPGACTGWARFTSGVLEAANVATNPDDVPVQGHIVIIEQPQVYRGSKQKGDPNDLIKLAILVGIYVQRARSAGARVELVTPQTWKGNVPKDIHNTRTLAQLMGHERAILPVLSASKSHNMIDAIGLGLWLATKENLR